MSLQSNEYIVIIIIYLRPRVNVGEGDGDDNLERIDLVSGSQSTGDDHAHPHDLLLSSSNWRDACVGMMSGSFERTNYSILIYLEMK